MPPLSSSSSSPPRARRSGPIAVRGYPTSVGSGFAAVALYGGFTRDGSELGVCWSDGGSDEMYCRFVDRLGVARTFSEPFVYERNDLPQGSIDPLSEVAVWLERERIPRLQRMQGPDAAAWDLLAPPLTGSWSHPEITLEVREIPPVTGRGGVELSPPRLDLGGRIEGVAEAVFPYSYSPQPDPNPAHFVRLNVLALSPDGRELGIVTHAPRMEYDSSYAFARIPVAELAERVTALATR